MNIQESKTVMQADYGIFHSVYNVSKAVGVAARVRVHPLPARERFPVWQTAKSDRKSATANYRKTEEERIGIMIFRTEKREHPEIHCLRIGREQVCVSGVPKPPASHHPSCRRWYPVGLCSIYSIHSHNIGNGTQGT